MSSALTLRLITRSDPEPPKDSLVLATNPEWESDFPVRAVIEIDGLWYPHRVSQPGLPWVYMYLSALREGSALFLVTRTDAS